MGPARCPDAGAEGAIAEQRRSSRTSPKWALFLGVVPSGLVAIAERLFDVREFPAPETPCNWPPDLPPELFQGWEIDRILKCPLCGQLNLFGRVTCPGPDTHCEHRVAAALRLAVDRRAG